MKKLNSFSKRILALLLSLLMLLTSGILSAVAVTVDLAQTGANTVASDGSYRLYFKFSGGTTWWNGSGCYHFAWVWGTNMTSQYRKICKVGTTSNASTGNTTDVFYMDIPSGTLTGMILFRAKASNSFTHGGTSWVDGVWYNKTNDITIPNSIGTYNLVTAVTENSSSITQTSRYTTVEASEYSATVTNANGGTGSQSNPYLVTAGQVMNVSATSSIVDHNFKIGYGYNDSSQYSTNATGTVTAGDTSGVSSFNVYFTPLLNGSTSYRGTQKSTTIYYQVAASEHTVTFKDHDGSILKTETVAHGESATAPEVNGKTGYTHTGWNKDFSNVTSDLTVTAEYTANSQAVKVKVNPTEGGTVTGYSDSAAYDSKVTFTATANTGYRFTGWSGTNGSENITGTDASLSITVKGDVDVTATFEKLTECTVTISSADTSMGNVDKTSVTGYSGDKVTITATPVSSDYAVDYWEVDGVKVDEGNETYTLTITGNHTVTVHWVKQGWTGIIYVEDAHSTSWESMNIYTYKTGTTDPYTGAWPGTAMTQITETEDGHPVYAIRVDVDSSIVASDELEVILSNNGASQTEDYAINVTPTQNYVILSDSGITYKWSNLSVDLPITVYFDNGTTDTEGKIIGQTKASKTDNPDVLIDIDAEAKFYKQDSFTDLGGYRKATIKDNSNIVFTTTMETMNDDGSCDYYVAGWVINGDQYVEAKYMGKVDGFDYYQGSYTFTENRNTVVPIYFHTANWLAAHQVDTVKVYAVSDSSVTNWDRYMGAYTWYTDADDNSGYKQFGMWQGQLMIPVVGLDNVYYTFVEKTDPAGDPVDGITFSNFGYNGERPSYPVTEYSNIQTYDYYEFLELLEQGKENITFVLKPETDTAHFEQSFSTNTNIANDYDFEVFTDASALKTPLDIDRNPAISEEVGLYIVRQFVYDVEHSVGDFRIVCHLYKPDGTYIGNCTSYELLDIPTLSKKDGFSYLDSTQLDGKRVMVEYESKTTHSNGTRIDGEWYGDADVNVKVNLYAYVGLTTDNGANFTTDTDETDGLNVADYGSAYAEGGAVATVVKGKSASISAVPKAGYKFIGWYSPNGALFSKNSTYTIADVSFDTYVTAVFQKLKDDEFVITHELYTGGATGYNPDAFGGTGDLYIGVANEDGTDISPLAVRDSLSFDAVEGNRYIIKIATDPHGADKFYAWYTSALDKFGNTTYEEVGVDNFNQNTEYGNLFDNKVDTVVGSNGLVQFWFYHTVGTDFTLDLYSNITAVSANVKLIYKYEDRVGAARSVTVPYTLTDKEVDNGYVPSDDVVKANAPYVDDYYTDVTWDISKFDDNSFIIWANQPDPVYIVKLNYASNTDIIPGTYNSEMSINATELGAKSDKGYWFEDANENQSHDEGEKIVAYGRYYGLVITEDVTLCYVEDASIDFDIVLDQPVYTREQETDASGNITTDKIYIDYLTSILIPLFRYDKTAGGEKITDTYYNDVVIPNANSPVTIETLTEHFDYEIEYGVILEQLQNTADFGVNRSGDDTLVDYLNGERYNSERNRYATVFNATSNPITNKNRLLITIDMKNSSNNQKKYYNVYGYLKVKDDAGETKYYFSDMRTLNIYEIGNSKGEQIVVSQ